MHWATRALIALSTHTYYGIPVSFHTDYPILSNSSDDPFEFMEIVVTSVYHLENFHYGDNKQITDGNCDKSLAVKCINGTFVGKKNEGVIAYKGIPFVGKQPVG